MKSEQKINTDEAASLLGWAHFNLYKGKDEAVHILIDKALVALGKEPWHENSSS